MSSPVHTGPDGEDTSRCPAYQPYLWGQGLAQGIAKALQSKIKTSDLTLSQLVRASQRLDDYLRRWREAKPPTLTPWRP